MTSLGQTVIELTLKIGNRGPAVLTLQRQLLARGYDPKGLDGIFGPNTANAVRLFQFASRLRETGQADPATRAALAAPTVVESQARGGMEQARGDMGQVRDAVPERAPVPGWAWVGFILLAGGTLLALASRAGGLGGADEGETLDDVTPFKANEDDLGMPPVRSKVLKHKKAA